MQNVTNKVMQAWYTLLNGNLSVPVFMVSVPASHEGHYVLIRPESDTETANNHKWISNPVIITEVVTQFETIVDYTVAADIDEEIGTLLYDNPSHHNLPAQDDIQITSVKRRDATYLPEEKVYSLITRNVHRVEQLINQS
jgi:hypothetical protein